jgi:glyoxylase-like metal-dependent hydrolase (beta-lactamase superfamily II)
MTMLQPSLRIRMRTRLRHLIVLPALVALSACSPGEPTSQPEPGSAAEGGAPTTAELAQQFVEAIGGRAALENVETMVLRGDGTRTRMGQIESSGGEDPMGRLENVTETIDLANGRAAFDYDVNFGEFGMHRTEVLTTFEGTPVGWNTGPGRPNIATSPNGLFSWATQNSPQMLLRRNFVTIALAAADTASSRTAEERSFDGRASLYGTARLSSGEEIGLHFDPQTSLLNGFTALDTETMLGDVAAEYALGDYRAVNGLTLPHSITIRKQDRPYSSIEYSSITLNDPAALEVFEIPQDAVEHARQVVQAPGPWAPLALEEVAPGVLHVVGYSHHGMVVEFPSFVAVVEAPYTDAQSATLVRLVAERIDKPIRYVAPTHPHYDHIGGLREVMAAGADAVVAAGHEAELRAILEAPQTNPPDELARRRQAGQPVGGIEVFAGSHVIEEGEQRLELYEVTTIPHVQPKLLAYVPGAGAIFQSDVFFGAPGPDATALYEAIRDLELDVQMIVGGHGGVLPFSSLEEAAAAAR